MPQEREHHFKRSINWLGQTDSFQFNESSAPNTNTSVGTKIMRDIALPKGANLLVIFQAVACCA